MEWACPACTLVNSESRCVACGYTEDRLDKRKKSNEIDGDLILAEVLSRTSRWSPETILSAVKATNFRGAKAAIDYLENDSEEQLSDFVLSEYIKDFARFNPDILDPKALESFIRCMESIGISSEKNRQRAFILLERYLQEEKDVQYARSLQDNRPQQQLPFKCISCNTGYKEIIYLSNCDHSVCHGCLTFCVDLDPPVCTCGREISHLDIRQYFPDKADYLEEFATRQALLKNGGLQCQNKGCSNILVLDERRGWNKVECPQCRQVNCLQCSVIHLQETCSEYRAIPELEKFLYEKGQTKDFVGLRIAFTNAGGDRCPRQDLVVRCQAVLGTALPPLPCSGSCGVYWEPQNSNFALFDVPPNSEEFQNVLNHLQGETHRILKVQRVQNTVLWDRYTKYYAGKHRGQVKERLMWHGTRNNAPMTICERGFDKGVARVGGCIWFAVQSTYSMGSFSHTTAAGERVVLLAAVACGDAREVKFIRGDLILNVFVNEATYPAYIVTFR